MEYKPMNGVPLVDFKRQYADLRNILHQAACQVIDSAHYIGGEEVKAFEQEMAQWLGMPEVCGVACATSGLFAALKCLGIGPGDEVITTVHTAIATAEAISLTGATVVFCDIQKGYYNIDPAQAEKKITDKTRALVPVHLYGQPADMDAFLQLGRKHKLLVIEDCAQAQGAKYRGNHVGTLGDAGVFSFFPSKNLGGFGDGGAVTAKDPAVMKKIRMFSNHGRTSKYLHEFEGINSRLDALQAALLRVCLPRLDAWNAHRRLAASWYDEGLSGIEQLAYPQVLPHTEPVYHVYVIRVPDRDRLQAFLKKHGIETGIHYPYSLNTLPAYAHSTGRNGNFAEAEDACAHIVSLPMFPAITREEVEYVCSTIKSYFKEAEEA
jgi:dTDP-4-amino-4,6-dideoxygalactose transaminase